MTPDKNVIENYFSYFLIKMYVAGTQKNRLKRPVILCVHPKHVESDG